MNCKRCGKYIGEYSGRGSPKQYCKSCKTLGTTNMGSIMCKKKDGKPDFEEELTILRKELKGLGLRK